LYYEIDGVFANTYQMLNLYGMTSTKEAQFDTKDSFDIFTHHVFLHLCNIVIGEVRKGNKVIFLLTDNNRWDWQPALYKNITKVSKLVIKLLPVSHIRTELSLMEFEQAYIDGDVKTVTDLDRVVNKMQKNTFKPFTLNKLIDYLDKRGLKYLSSKYFQQVNSKLLAANK
jgi:hypothetical protein